jgi:putative ABC transport system permease protein
MLRDLLSAVRWLRHNPLFTLAIVGILALGIGANTAIFSMIDAVLLRPLPYASPGTLIAVKETSNKHPAGGMSASDYLLWRDRTDLFAKTVPYGAPLVAILNQTLARELFPDRDPVGQILADPGAAAPVTVVGVVGDSPQMSYERPAEGELYQSYQQYIFGVFMSTIVVRTPGEPFLVADTLRKAVWEVDRNQPIVKVETMTDAIADAIWRPRFSAWVFTALGVLALILTSAGVYGVVSYSTTLRAREVGIRVALGATPTRVVATVLWGALAPLAAGLAAGVVGALLLSRFLVSLLYEISGADPVAYLVAGVLLLAIGALASARPAWRAAVGDPLEALRM